jgi:hypothetical protein
MPTGGDGVLDIVLNTENQAGENIMPTDMAEDMTQILLEEGGRVSNLLLGETAANVQHISNVARSAGVKKFDEVGPLESAAVEQVLGR